MKLSFVAFLIGFSCLAVSTEARDSCDSKYSECKTKAVLCQTSGQTCTVTGASCRAEWRKCKGDRRRSLKGANGEAVCDLACSIASKPVCGSDGVTYTNKCWFDTQALCEDPSLTIAYEGECASDN